MRNQNITATYDAVEEPCLPALLRPCPLPDRQL